ncbi:AraC family transcriptional regulator [Citrobacter sp. JUb117]|uniref:AraC family transcriptional regulator n=1 Tax=Citrobacter sp. JUb117 TaxID=2940600 RepID=UPI00216A6F2C|nr:AraC family transcriptional regulator [Citrobacter sp. JUb117]MCS3464152.1 AraC-like DNA-binding protein [Citrobacter sp. JUb117]
MTSSPQLDLIDYDDLHTEFRRVKGTSVDYYHWHQCMEFLYIESGYGLVIVDNQRFTLKPGRLFVFPQNKLHKVKVDSMGNNIYARTIVHVDPESMKSFIQPFESAYQTYMLFCSEESKVSIYDLTEHMSLMSQLITLSSAKYNNASRTNELVSLYVLNLLHILPTGTFVNAGATGLTSPKIMNYIEKNFLHNIKLREIADYIGLSSGYTSRVFKNETGGTIQEYLIVRRIKHACFLLEDTQLTVSDIAKMSGFNHVTYFIKCFSQVVGITPLRYKKNNTIKHNK